MAELREVRPDAAVGKTAKQGQYYNQALNMDFSKQNAITYTATGKSGNVMWLYVNEKLNRICCGNKE